MARYILYLVVLLYGHLQQKNIVAISSWNNEWSAQEVVTVYLIWAQYM